MFKKTVQLCLGIVLAVELTGCVYYASDHRYHPYWHHHDDGIVVHVHD